MKHFYYRLQSTRVSLRTQRNNALLGVSLVFTIGAIFYVTLSKMKQTVVIIVIGILLSACSKVFFYIITGRIRELD